MSVPTADRKRALITGISGQDGSVTSSPFTSQDNAVHLTRQRFYLTRLIAITLIRPDCCRSYLAELLLAKNYIVHGLSRSACTQQSSSLNAILATGQIFAYGVTCNVNLVAANFLVPCSTRVAASGLHAGLLDKTTILANICCRL